MGVQSRLTVEEVAVGDGRDELPPGTELVYGQYVINDYLGADGFGITYLASDRKGQHLVIKECFPGAFCRRQARLVQPRSPGHDTELRSIVRLFAEEAAKLSRLNHPSIVGIHEVFEENNTAYIAMDFVDGCDLLEVIHDDASPLSSEQIQNHLSAILDAIGFVHRCGMLHRDISPENIIVREDGKAVLIDFAAARDQATKASRILSVLRVVKDGYSPQEFYISGSEQGPSCDLYSLAASFYHIITGQLPPGSQQRLAARASGQTDPYIPLADLTEDFDADFCVALDKAMSVIPHERFQSAEEWIEAIQPKVKVVKLRINAERPASTPTAEVSREADTETTVEPLVGATAEGSFETFDEAGTDDIVPNATPRPASHFTEFRQSLRAEQSAPSSTRTTKAFLGGAMLVSGVGVAILSAMVLGGSNSLVDVTVLEPSVESPSFALSEWAPNTPKFEPVTRNEVPILLATSAEVETHGIADENRVAPEFRGLEAPKKAKLVASPTQTETDQSPSKPKATALPTRQESMEENAQIAATLNSGEAVAAIESSPTQQVQTSETVGTLQIGPTAISEASIDQTESRTAVAKIESTATSLVKTSSVPILPFMPTQSDSQLIGSVAAGAPSWMQSGLKVVSANGVPIETIGQVQSVLADGLALDATDVEVSLGVVQVPGEAVTYRTFEVPVVHKISLSDGLKLESRFKNGEWVTHIADATEGGALAEGFVVVGLVRTGQRFNDPESVRQIIETELMDGRTDLALAVERNGKLWVETFPL